MTSSTATLVGLTAIIMWSLLAALRYDTEPAQDFVSSYVVVRGLHLA